jgi:hypothetical protein
MSAVGNNAHLRRAWHTTLRQSTIQQPRGYPCPRNRSLPCHERRKRLSGWTNRNLKHRDQALSASARSHCSDRLDLEQPAGIERLCIIMVEAGSPPCSLRPRIARLAAVGRGGVHLHEMLDAQAGGREHGIPTPVRIAPRSLRHDAVRTSRCLIADEQQTPVPFALKPPCCSPRGRVDRGGIVVGHSLHGHCPARLVTSSPRRARRSAR